MQIVTLLNRETRAIIADRIEFAGTSLKRLVGLLGRKELHAGEGLWLAPSSGVHTFGMSFPIDVVGLDKDLRVVKLWRNVKPQRLTSLSANVRSVLELRAGEIDFRLLQVGQYLCIDSEMA